MSTRDLLTGLTELTANPYIPELHEDDCPNTDCPGCARPEADLATEPLIAHWDRGVTFFDDPDEDTLVQCMSDDGRPVALFLDEEHREALGLLLVDPDGEVDKLRARLAELEPYAPTGHDMTEQVEYKVVGGWGVDGTDSAQAAVDAVLAARRAHPWDQVYAQQRTVRTWDDDSQWYGPWTDVPGAELPTPSQPREDPYVSFLHTDYGTCRDLPATP
jgi:hypothetical protein